MRFLILSSLLCVLLLCFSIFSVEGERRPRHHAKRWRAKPCCSQGLSPIVKARKVRHVKICRPCKLKPDSSSWVLPGALPLV